MMVEKKIEVISVFISEIFLEFYLKILLSLGSRSDGIHVRESPSIRSQLPVSPDCLLNDHPHSGIVINPIDFCTTSISLKCVTRPSIKNVGTIKILFLTSDTSSDQKCESKSLDGGNNF